MSRHRWKKWISDRLDGRLSEPELAILEKHLSECQSCRTYLDHLEMIRFGAREMEKKKISSRYREEFSARLNRELRNSEEGKKQRIPANGRLVYQAAAAAAALGLFLVFVVFQPRFIITEEFFAFSIDGSLSEIYSDISSSQDLEELFNSLVLVSIDEALVELGWSGETFILENPLDLYMVSGEELGLPEVKKDEGIKIEEKGYDF